MNSAMALLRPPSFTICIGVSPSKLIGRVHQSGKGEKPS